MLVEIILKLKDASVCTSAVILQMVNVDETVENIALHLGDNHNGKDQNTVHQAHQSCPPSAGPVCQHLYMSKGCLFRAHTQKY